MTIRQLKILNVVWGFAGGGVDKVVEAYARMNRVAPVASEIVCLHGQSWGTDVDMLEKMQSKRIVFRNRSDFSWIRNLALLIDQTKPDILFAHGFNAPVAALLALRKTSIRPPLACSYHGMYHAPYWSRVPLVPLFNEVLHWIYRKHADGVVAVSEYSRKFLVDEGIPMEKVVTIHNGLRPRPELSGVVARDEFGLQPNDFVIGVASRIDPIKGITHLVAALPKILHAVPKARLIILGRGPEEDALKQQCADLGVTEAVRFVGFQENVDAWFDLFDVFALPSLAENHSIALLEAMRAGRAIVATAVGGNTESVTNKIEALIVPPADPASLATALIRLATDKELAEGLARAARLRFEREFSETVMLQSTARWLEGIVDRALTS